MEILLQIIGSLASIGGIPLAIYLYLRSREAKYTKLRQETLKILSFQIGEGRNLSTFEVQAVIDSKLREHKLRQDSIKLREIIEDLITETISSPMLESQRKKEILANLQQIHQRGRIFSAIDKYSISYKDLIRSIHNIAELSAEDSMFISKEIAEPEAIVEVEKIPMRYETLSSIFALIAIIGVLLTFLSIFTVNPLERVDPFIAFLKSSSFLSSILAGILVSLVALALTALFARKRKSQKLSKNKKKAEIEEHNKGSDIG